MLATESPTRSTSTPTQTAWVTVLLAVAAGMLAAFQVGKVHIALPAIRQTFSLSLFSSSWVISALSFVGIFVAAPAGSICARVGNKRSVVTGLLLIAAACACGGYAPTLNWLLLSRLIEGIGFVIVVVAAPSLIIEVTRPADMRIALSGWSAYMPGGVALITFLAPMILAHHTWRTLWWFNSLLLLLAALAVALLVKQPDLLRRDVPTQNPWADTGAVLTSRGPLLLSIIFCLYTMQHLSIMGFLPTILHERFQLSDALVGVLVSTAMASNVLGNLAAGVLLQRGVALARIIAVAAIFMACMTAFMFIIHPPLPVLYACAFGFSCVGGLIPSCVMGAAPFQAPSTALIGATNGLLVQGSNLGIVLGPPLVSSIATGLGWSWIPAMTILVAVLSTILARNLSASTRSHMV